MIYKNITRTNILLLAILTFALTACNDEFYLPNSENDVLISKEKIHVSWESTYGLTNIPSEGGSISTSFHWCGGKTELGGVPAWASASATRFNNRDEYKLYEDIEFKVESNSQAIQRTAILMLTASGNNGVRRKAQTEMTQNAGALKAKFVSDSPTLSAAGETIQLQYTTNGVYDDVYFECYSSWISFTKTDDGFLEITADANPGSARDAVISLYYKSKGCYDRIKILQNAPKGSFNGDEKIARVGNEGGTTTISFTSETAWELSASQTWINITPEKGQAGKNTVKLSVSPNNTTSERNGIVNLYTSGRKLLDSYKIIQEGLKLDLSATTLKLDYTNGREKLNITSNTLWRIKSDDDWITVATTEGKGNGSVEISAKDNKSINVRKGEITVFLSNNNAVVRKVSVIQDGVPYGVDKKNLVFPWTGETQTIHLSTPSEWNCAVSESWISLDRDKGNGESDLSVTCTANTGAEERSGYVMIKSEGEPLTINIVQQGQYFYLDNTGSEINAMGGKIELTVHSSVGAKCAIEGKDSDWLTFEKTDADGVYMLSAAYNSSSKSREATFVIEPTMDNIDKEYTSGLKYTVKQNGRRLIPSVPTIYISRKGGQSTTCHITADGDIDVYKDPSDGWYILEYDSKTQTFFVTATENSTAAQRTGTVHLELKKLPEGESKEVDVKIIQINDTFDVEVGGFTGDEDWN